MKYLKKYETLQSIEIGDYVICDDDPPIPSETPFIKFLSENIGKYVYQFNSITYLIQYENIPTNLIRYFNPGNPTIKPEFRGNSRIFTIDRIIRLATPEEIKNQMLKNDANKYNL